jgi:hypothetical protein
MWGSLWNEIWQEKPKYSDKTYQVPFCLPQIPHNQTWVRSRVVTVGRQQLTALATVRPGNLNRQKINGAIVQGVSRCLPTAADRFQTQVRSCRIYGGQSGTGTGFFSSTSVSPANSQSTICSIFIYHPELVQLAN